MPRPPKPGAVYVKPQLSPHDSPEDLDGVGVTAEQMLAAITARRLNPLKR
jgi:hypothetical protein